MQRLEVSGVVRLIYRSLGVKGLSECSVRRRGRHLHNTQGRKRRTSTPSAGIEPVIPEIKRLQTYTLDHTATGISTQVPTAH